MAQSNGRTVPPAAQPASSELPALLSQELPASLKRRVIQGHLISWQEAYYGSIVAARIAREIGDPEDKQEQIRAEAARYQRGIQVVQQLLAELEPADQVQP